MNIIFKIKNIIEKLMILLPDWITGDSRVLFQKYHQKYGDKDCRALVQKKKTRTMCLYLLIIILFILLSTISLLLQINNENEITKIRRPKTGDQEMIIPVKVQMKYKGYEFLKSASLRIPQKLLSSKEKSIQMEAFKEQLSQLILGENTDLKHISKPMNFIEHDDLTGINIDWESSNPQIIDSEGFVNLLEVKDKQEVKVTAKMVLDDIFQEETFLLQIDTDASENDYNISMEKQLTESIEKIVGTNGRSEIILPVELNGAKLKWHLRKNNNLPLLFIVFIIAVLVAYFTRYDQINKEIKVVEESIMRDLPEFMNKLVLLLNAGLVASSAIHKIVADYEELFQHDKKKNRRYLYEELYQIQKKADQSNTPLVKELRQFALRSGVREFIRITAVISDNWDKGSTMVEKLQGESEFLWISRKKRAEEWGRLAETNLTFPIMIKLIVLIVITIAPAMMNM